MERLLRIDQVIERIGVSRTTIHRLRRDSQFPKPVTIRGRTIAWPEADIDDWIRRKAADRDAE